MQALGRQGQVTVFNREVNLIVRHSYNEETKYISIQ